MTDDSFIDVIDDAGKAGLEPDPSMDLSSPFPPSMHPADMLRVIQGEERVDGKIPGIKATDEYEPAFKLFNMARDEDEYLEVQQRIMRGEAIARFEDRTWTKEGDYMIAMSWANIKKVPSKKQNPIEPKIPV